MPGLWQHFSIPVQELYEPNEPIKGIWSEGIGFDGSSIRGFQKIQESDMNLFLGPASAIVDPACSAPTLSIICDIYDPATKRPYTRDPRYVTLKAAEYLKSTGIAEDSYWSPELEFFVFNDIRFDQNQNSGYYFIDSTEAIWNSGADEKPNLGYKPQVATAGQCEIDMRYTLW